ncbi:hypothetical protein EY643_08420 [Halioglobus maricola]|uniref:Uncharacterized protein n=1 Tax=Halioglobus maricola TaxID=2601894 RepID=A0A5P9NJE8_9GAMM|nr:hypothetical protein [Halioglobus maricola]QFU75675.1 hypothetical protein EY643_08420 [Halioglobus maricola]
MNPDHHLRKEAWISGVSNAIFNGLIAWLLLRNGPELAWGGQSSFAFDVLATAFILPFIVALIVIPLQRGKLRKGKLESIALGPENRFQKFADRLPHNTFKSALCFGLSGLCTIAPLTLLGFYILDIDSVRPTTYSIFKGIWAGLMAAALVVPMVLVALRPTTNKEV